MTSHYVIEIADQLMELSPHKTLGQAKYFASAVVKRLQCDPVRIYLRRRGVNRLISVRRFGVKNWGWYDVKR